MFHDVFVVTQIVDVKQTVHADGGQLHERAEFHHRGDHSLEGLADAIAQVHALEPGVDIAIRFVGAFLELCELGTGQRELRAVVALAVGVRVRQHAAQGAMYHEVRVAPDRRSEVRVVPEREAEVPDVLGLVDSLLHGSHDQRLQEGPLLVVGEAVGDGAEIPRLHVLGQVRGNAQ